MGGRGFFLLFTTYIHMANNSYNTEVAVTAAPSTTVVEVGVQHLLRARGTDITIEEWSSSDAAYYTTGTILDGEDKEFVNASPTGRIQITGVGAGTLVIVKIRLEVM
jgi:hypothetical protein